ncbi:MAG: GNAT family N-acetyltransferase [Candidatus Cyclobacteriaceae bacterium M2_1C_046]
MKDMLVKLLSLPDPGPKEENLNREGIIFRKPIAPEKSIVRDWVLKNFSTYWANEVDAAFGNSPVTCFIAQKGNDLVGIACYEATYKNFFGPTGTLEAYRNKGIGEVLLLKSLSAMKEMGYAYAIIGGVGPASYYSKIVNAVEITGSENSIYKHLLK